MTLDVRQGEGPDAGAQGRGVRDGGARDDRARQQGEQAARPSAAKVSGKAWTASAKLSAGRYKVSVAGHEQADHGALAPADIAQP